MPTLGSTEVFRDDRFFHDLRRTGGRNLIKSRVSPKTAILISGHKTDDIFRPYQIVDGNDIEEACEKVEQLQQKKKAGIDKLSKTYQKPLVVPSNLLDMTPANTEPENLS